MKLKNFKKHTLVIGTLEILFLIFIIVLDYAGSFSGLEQKAYDYWMQVKGGTEAYENLVLVDIDDNGVQALGKWPWKRSVSAKMINRLAGRNAKTVIYDILFAYSGDKADDGQLVAAVAKAGNLFFPVGFDISRGKEAGTDKTGSQEAGRLKQYVIPRPDGQVDQVLSAANPLTPMKELIKAAKGLGHAYTNRDEDGIVRRVPLIINMDGNFFPSLPLAAVMDYLNVSPNMVKTTVGKHIILKGAKFPNEGKPRDVVIPIDKKGMMLINYPGVMNTSGKWTSNYKHHLFHNVIGLNKTENKNLPDFQNKIVLVDNIVSGASDIKSIPVSKSYPGGWIIAAITNTVLTENFLEEISTVARISLILLLGLLSIIGELFGAWYKKLAYTVVLFAGYHFLNYFWFYKYQGVLSGTIVPSAVIAGTLFIQLLSGTRRAGILQKTNQTILGAVNEFQKAMEDFEKSSYDEDEHEIVELKDYANKLKVVVENEKMLNIFNQAIANAKSDNNLLIIGSKGTGKSYWAKLIYELYLHNKQDAPCAAFDCRLIPLYLDLTKEMEKVKGGIMAFNRVECLQGDNQKKLLEFLSRNDQSIKIIATANSGITSNSTLHRQLSQEMIVLPELSERAEDIPYFADQLLMELGVNKEVFHITDDAMDFLTNQTWDNNIDQLKETIKTSIECVYGGKERKNEIELCDIKKAINILELDKNDKNENAITTFKLSQEEEQFIAVLNQKQFNTTLSRKKLGMGSAMFNDRSKEICFKILDFHGGDINNAAKEIIADSTQFDLADKFIGGRCKSLQKKIKNCKDISEAKTVFRKAWPNVRNPYYVYIDKYIEVNFSNLVGEIVQ